VTQEALLTLVAESKLFRNSLVWRKGLSNWIRLDQAELPLNDPPPLQENAIQDWIVWLMAFAPIFLRILQTAVGYSGAIAFGVAFISYAVLASIDLQNIKKAGNDPGALGQGWVFFVPVYLWKRAKLLRQSQAYFWVFIGALVVSSL